MTQCYTFMIDYDKPDKSKQKHQAIAFDYYLQPEVACQTDNAPTSCKTPFAPI